MRLKSLFWETSEERELAKFTLKLEDHYVEEEDKTYPSAYQIFMQARTEYEAGIEIVGSFHLWDKLISQKWFLTGKGCQAAYSHIGLEEWRRHKRLKDYSEQIKNLKKKAAAGDTAAAKAVLQITEKAEKESRVGRPKKKSPGDPAKNLVADFQAQMKKLKNR